MEQFKWTDSYSVGVKEIDEQHQEFFRITNDLIKHADKKAETTKDRIMELVRALNDYALFHLGTEEKYFTEFDCAFQTHIQTHNAFREQVKKFFGYVNTSASDYKSIASDMALFCGHWLAQHIFVMDKEYTECFHEHGLK